MVSRFSTPIINGAGVGAGVGLGHGFAKTAAGPPMMMTPARSVRPCTFMVVVSDAGGRPRSKRIESKERKRTGRKKGRRKRERRRLSATTNTTAGRGGIEIGPGSLRVGRPSVQPLPRRGVIGCIAHRVAQMQVVVVRIAESVMSRSLDWATQSCTTAPGAPTINRYHQPSELSCLADHVFLSPRYTYPICEDKEVIKTVPIKAVSCLASRVFLLPSRITALKTPRWFRAGDCLSSLGMVVGISL